MRVPADTLVALPEALSYSEGAAIACGTGTAFRALKRMNLTGRDTIAVFGQGPVGLSVVLLAAEMGARVIAVELSQERLEMARTFGVAETIDPGAIDPVEAIREMTRGEGASLTIDCSGSPTARVQAVRSTLTWGTTCLVGEGGSMTLDVSKDIMRRQLTIMGSWTFSSVDQGDCARYIAERGIDLDRIFTHRFFLDEAESAYRLFDKQSTGKGVFEF